MDKKRIRTHDDILDLISQYDQEERTKRRKKKGKEWEEDSDEDYSKKKAKLKEAYTEYTPDEDEAIVLAKPVFPLIRDKWNSLQMPSTIVKEELPETTNAFLLYDVLSKQHCKLLIDAAENQEFQYAEEYSHLYKERYHDRLVFEDENLASILYSRMHKFLPRTVNEDWKVVELNDRLRIWRYSEEHYTGMHIDSSYKPSAHVTTGMSILLYLNSPKDGDFVGGNTNFYDEQGLKVTSKVVPEAGMALLFPQNDMNMLYEESKVETGTKFVLRLDALYRAPEEEEFVPESFISSRKNKKQ